MNNRGSLLITSIWALIILSIFAVSLARGASTSLVFSGYLKDKVVAHYLARAGIKKVAQNIIEDETKDYDSLSDSWGNIEDEYKDIKIGSGSFSVSYVLENENGENTILYGAIDEEGRININTANADMLKNLFMLKGDTEEQDAKEIADAILDWVDEDSEKSENGAEDVYYEGLNPAYTCKDNLFESVEELMLIRGVTDEIFEKVKKYITVYGEGLININTIDKGTLEAIGATTAAADKVDNYRKGGDGVYGTEDDNFFLDIKTALSEIESGFSLTPDEKTSLNTLLTGDMLTVTSKTFRVKSTGYRKLEKSKRTIEVVLQKVYPVEEEGKELTDEEKGVLQGIKVLYWRES